MVGHPFDLVKVRLQTEGQSGRFRGPLHCVTHTVRSEGLRSLYKGVTPPLLGTGVINALVFGMQGIFTAKIKELDGLPSNAPATLLHTCQASLLSGVCISVVVTPIEGIKSRLQVQYHALGRAAAASASGSAGSAAAASSSAAAAAAAHAAAPLYTGPRSCIKYVLQHQGVMGLYRGFLPVVYCRMSNWAYFGAYEFWKGQYARMRPNSGSGGVGQSAPSKSAAIFAGGMSGISYWLACYPMDVIKARMMSVHTHETRSVRATAATIYRQGGWKGFLAGFTPCLARAFPANAAAFLAFEYTMGLLPP
jgi:solute carrier family 25 carnitine/acylcarnitine transporter 20/29